MYILLIFHIRFVVGIDEGIEVENGLSAASSSSEGSNFSSEAATNDKNARECTSQVTGSLNTDWSHAGNTHLVYKIQNWMGFVWQDLSGFKTQ